MTGIQRIDLGLTDANAACSCCATDDSHGASASGAAVASGSAETSSLSAEFLVEGMTCSHCVSSVTEELSEIEGVEGVAVDLRVGGASVVTVTSSGPVSDDAVRAAVEEAGYTLAAPAA